MEKTDAETSLEEALPALEEARTALSDLDRNDVTEIRLDMYWRQPLLGFSTRLYDMIMVPLQVLCKASCPSADSV